MRLGYLLVGNLKGEYDVVIEDFYILQDQPNQNLSLRVQGKSSDFPKLSKTCVHALC